MGPVCLATLLTLASLSCAQVTALSWISNDCDDVSSCLASLIVTSANSTWLSLFPGVGFVPTGRTRELSTQLIESLSKPSPAIDHLFYQFVGSLNLTVQLEESGLLATLPPVTGRARKSAWYALGTVAAVGFAMLAALSGKALMASVFALMMSSLSVIRSTNGGFPSSAPSKFAQYEIIAKPAGYATAPAHYYDHEHHHAAYSTSYKRNLDEPS